MTNIFFAVFLAFFYSIVYTVAGPMIAAQDIKFDQSQLLSFAVCFILSSAVNFFIFSVIPKLHLCTGNGRVSQYLNRGLDKVGNRRLFLFVWAFICVVDTCLSHLIPGRFGLRYDFAGGQRSR